MQKLFYSFFIVTIFNASLHCQMILSFDIVVLTAIGVCIEEINKYSTQQQLQQVGMHSYAYVMVYVYIFVVV